MTLASGSVTPLRLTADGFRLADFLTRTSYSYGGMVHGTDRHGVTDVEYPTLSAAAAHVETIASVCAAFGSAGIPVHMRFRDPVQYFTDNAYVVQYSSEPFTS